MNGHVMNRALLGCAAIVRGLCGLLAMAAESAGCRIGPVSDGRAAAQRWAMKGPGHAEA